jgi:hypothetical protein
MEEVAAALLTATQQSNRGVTAAEAYAVYAARDVKLSSSSFATVLLRLEAHGIAKKLGGRHRQTRWQHADHPVPLGDSDDIAPALLEIVEALHERHGRPIDTREVHAALAATGVIGYTRDQVRTRLESLAHSSPRKSARSTDAWATPRLRRLSTRTSAGKSGVHWLPLHAEAEVPSFRHRTDAVRHAVQAASIAFGRPVSRRELDVWAESPEFDTAVDREAAAVVLSPKFRQHLGNVLASDEGRAGTAVRRVATPFTSRGMYAPRFAAASPTELEYAVCLAEDLAKVLRVDLELRSVTELDRVSHEVGSALLRDIVDARRMSLRATIMSYAPPGVDPVGWLLEAVAAAEASAAKITDWNGGKAVPWLESLVALAEAVKYPVTGETAFRTVDRQTGEPFELLEGLCREVLALNDRVAVHWPPVISNALRVRGPVAAGISTDDPNERRSFLDRFDAIRTIFEACHLPKAYALVDGAIRLTGFVLRDAGALRTWLHEATVTEDVDSQAALTVALGLLGAAPAMNDAWPDPRNAGQAAAYLLAVSLGVDDSDMRLAFATAADLRARGAACAVTESALSRMECGARLSVIE